VLHHSAHGVGRDRPRPCLVILCGGGRSHWVWRFHCSGEGPLLLLLLQLLLLLLLPLRQLPKLLQLLLLLLLILLQLLLPGRAGRCW